MPATFAHCLIARKAIERLGAENTLYPVYDQGELGIAQRMPYLTLRTLSSLNKSCLISCLFAFLFITISCTFNSLIRRMGQKNNVGRSNRSNWYRGFLFSAL
jgi:hypothetical protein